MRKLRIVLDMDQVICQWVERIIQWWNEDKGTSVTRDDITSWDMKMNLGPNSEDFLRSCMRYPELYRDLDPVEGALYGVQRLLDKGHDVVIGTATPRCAGIAYAGKMEWIRRNMPRFDLKNLVSIHRKDLLAGWGDLLLDDGPHNIEAWRRTGKMAVVFDAPWNRQVAEGPTVRRVRHWNEFLQFVDEYERRLDESFFVYTPHVPKEP